MQQFTIPPGGFKQIQKKVLISTIAIMSLAIACSLFVSASNTNDGNIMPYLAPFICLIMGFSIYRAITKQKTVFESYKLTIDNDTLLREQLNTPAIRLRFDEVREIIKSTSGGFLIKASNSNVQIIIPAQVGDCTELEAILNSIMPLTVKKSSWLLYASYAAVVVTIGSMTCIYCSNNKAVVLPTGIILVAIMSWSFYQMRTNKNITTNTKRSSWYILFVKAAVITIVYNKLNS